MNYLPLGEISTLDRTHEAESESERTGRHLQLTIVHGPAPALDIGDLVLEPQRGELLIGRSVHAPGFDQLGRAVTQERLSSQRRWLVRESGV